MAYKSLIYFLIGSGSGICTGSSLARLYHDIDDITAYIPLVGGILSLIGLMLLP